MSKLSDIAQGYKAFDECQPTYTWQHIIFQVDDEGEISAIDINDLGGFEDQWGRPPALTHALGLLVDAIPRLDDEVWLRGDEKFAEQRDRLREEARI